MNDDIHTLALTFLLRHADLPRRAALEQCATHLIESQEVSQTTANRIALHAVAELESRNHPARIDTAATTAHVVIVTRPGRRPLALTVNDLLRLHAMSHELPAAAPARLRRAH